MRHQYFAIAATECFGRYLKPVVLAMVIACAPAFADGAGAPLDTLPDNAFERQVVALDAQAALAEMRNGRLSSERYVQALLNRIARYPELNAVIHLDPDQALADARAADQARADGIDLGPLHGLPVLIKDSINTSSYPTTAGTPALDGFVPAENAPVVQALLDAGAILLGKANLHELSGGYTTINPFTGPTLNPYDFSRVPGGSSGGNGAALAARMTPLAIGGDTLGSLRIPPGLCGIVGFRPSTGRYDATGGVPWAPTLDIFGPMARNVHDVALADAVLAGVPNTLPEVSLEGLRLAVPRNYFYDRLDPETSQALEQALERLEDHGAILVDAEVPFASELTREFGLSIIIYESVAAIATYLEQYDTGVDFFTGLFPNVASPDVAFALALSLSGFISDENYNNIIGFIEFLLKPAYQNYLVAGAFDAVLIPTAIEPAPELTELLDEARAMEILENYSRTGHFAPLVGAPAVSVPTGQLPDGLPAGGLDVMGAPGEDRRTLAIAAAIERALPKMRPPREIRPLPAGR